MKKIYYLLAITIAVFQINSSLFSQCALSGAYWGEMLPNAGCGNFANYSPFGPGQYFRMPVLEGGSYSISTCGNALDLQLTGYQGTSPQVFYNDDNGPICTGLQASVTYTSTFTDYLRVQVSQYNCQPGGSASITVGVRQNNNLSITSSSANMCAGQTRTLTATPTRVTVTPAFGSGDVGTFSGTGVSGTTFTAPTPAGASGVYTITYTFGYCSTTQNITVFRAPTTSNAGSDQTICNATTATLAGNTPTYGTGQWIISSGPGTVTTPSSPTSTITGLVPGQTTTLEWRITNGPCTASSDFVNIICRPTLNASISSQTNVACFGGNTGSATVSPTGGTGGYTYVWAPSGGTGVTASGLTAGSYTVIVTDANLCTASAVANITQPPVLSVTPLSQTNVSCNGGTNGAASINTPTGGAGGYTYNWTPGNPTGDGTPSVTGLTAGSWTCTVTDANSCTSSQTFNITQPSALTLTAASQTNISCNGGSNGAASVNSATGGSGGYTYNWTPGNPTGDGTPSVTGLTAGTWTCTVTDANSCTSSQTFNITQPSPISVVSASQTDISCFGGSNGAASINTPTGGAGGYSYNWTPGNPSGDGTTNASGLTAGTWTVTVTDANSCIATQTFTLTQPSSAITFTSLSQTNISCNGGSDGTATVNPASGGAGGFIYDWTPGTPSGDGTTSVTGLTAGSWTCTVTDASGCTSSQVFSLTQPASGISLTQSSQNNVTCNGGSNGAASVNNATGGAGGYLYDWTPGTPSGDGTISVTGLTAGTWTCTVTDANGCTASQTFSITQPTPISVVSASQTNISCFGGSNGAASINTPTGGAGGYSYNWTPGNPAGDGTTNVTGLTAGTWTVTVTDASSCTSSQTFNITEPSQLSITNLSQTNVGCFGGSDGAASINTPTGGAGGYSYNWTPGNPSGDGTTSVTGLSVGTWTVTVTDANSCTTLSTFSITEPSLLTTNVLLDSNVTCNGGTDGGLTVLPNGGTAGYTYSWSPSGGIGASMTGGASTYTVTVTDANGCTATQTGSITEPTLLTTTVTLNSNATCNGSTDGGLTALPNGGTAGYSYSWSPSGGTGASMTGGASTYTVTVTDANGCTATQTETITEPTLLTATVTVDSSATCNGSTDGGLTALPNGGTAGYSYSWSPSGGTGASMTGGASTYTVTVTDANGCTATQTETITEPTLLTATVTVDSSATCNGSTDGGLTALSNGGTAGYTYSWSPSGGTGASMTGGASTYTVTVTDANGCTATQTETITEPAVITINSTTTDEVNGNDGAINLTVSGGTPAYSYNWSNSATTEDLTNITGGTYTVTVTDANGCTQTAVIVVNSTVGIDENIELLDVNLYPNPTTGFFNLSIVNAITGEILITVFDIRGREVVNIKGLKETTEFIQLIDITEERSGVYFVKVGLSDGRSITKRIIKK